MTQHLSMPEGSSRYGFTPEQNHQDRPEMRELQRMIYFKASNVIHESGLIKAWIEPYRQKGVYPTPPCIF